MIISKTPHRISLFGGGTDIESFWTDEEGAVLSCTIDRYIYVIVKKSYDGHIHLRYFENEDVACVTDVRHDLIRECMKKAEITGAVEITVLSDIPHTGSGLGTSSSLTVGLLHALYTYNGISVSSERLAREACEIEIHILGNPIGKQDQYAAAYGGLNVLRFDRSGGVRVSPVRADYNVIDRLQEYLMLFYTGTGHRAADILKDQTAHMPSTRPILRAMKRQVDNALDLIKSAQIEKLGLLMRDGWIMKRQLSGGISNPFISELIERAQNAGAAGTKITGAGGGGFLLVFCDPSLRARVKRALSDLKREDIRLVKSGSTIVFRDDE